MLPAGMGHMAGFRLVTRGAEERKKKTEVGAMVPVLRFFEIFRSVFRKYFCDVFGFLMQRNGQKRDKKNQREDDRKKNQAFDMDFPYNFVCGVFELPLLRNAQKRHETKKKRRYHGTPFSGYLPNIGRFQKKSSAPLGWLP
jgi:hypothetical protein